MRSGMTTATGIANSYWLLLVYIKLYSNSIPLVNSSFLSLLLGSVAVMTKAYPNSDRSDLILLQDIASYLLLACGLIYVISVSLENFLC
jgi:hypothetical protein